MAQRWVSEPFGGLLGQADIAAEDVDDALQRLAIAGAPTVLRPGDAYLSRIQQATGINVIAVSRRHRHLLVWIEQHVAGRLAWTYSERSRNSCIFGCVGVIPPSIQLGLIGGPLAQLIEPTSALAELIVEDVIDQADGWTQLKLRPQWRPF